MKKLIALLTLFVGFSANASMINIEISDTNAAVGDTVSVKLLASGFESFDTFDFDFDFDTSVFNYDPTSLVSDLSAGFAFEVNQIAGGMGLSFFNFSPVSGDFLLASFDLIAVDEGSSSFGLSDVEFSDSLLQTILTVDSSDSGEAEVVASEVSAPATLSLFTMALLGLVGLRRKA